MYDVHPSSGGRARAIPTSTRDVAQGREEEALKLLQSIHNQFTEGFDTADLLEAKALLESLSPDSILKGSARVQKPRTSNRHRRPPSRRKKVK